jgi:hypothetical protein
VVQEYAVQVWPYGCDDATSFNKEFEYTAVAATRFINGSQLYPGDLDPRGLYTNLYINAEEIGTGNSTWFWVEDFMLLHGVMRQEPFIENGTDLISYKGRLVDCTRFTLSKGYVLQSICGLGWGIVIDTLVSHYYERTTGLLLYTESWFYEYVYEAPARYQSHKITRLLEDLDYPGKPADQNPIWDAIFEDLDWLTVRGYLGVVGIVSGAIGAFLIIRHKAFKFRVQQYLDMESRLAQEGSLDTDAAVDVTTEH